MNTNANVLWSNFDKLDMSWSFEAHKEAVTCVAIAGNKEFVVSVGGDSLLKMYTVADRRQVRSVSLSSTTLSSCVVLDDNKTLLVGCWDNNV